MTNTLKFLRQLHGLRELSKDGSNPSPLEQIERDLLSMTGYSPSITLTVMKPHMFALEGDQKDQFIQAFRIQYPGAKIPTSIDIIGHSEPQDALDPSISIVSPAQLEVDHVDEAQLYLNPLIEQIYGTGSAVVREFTVCEDLAGDVQVLLGNYSLPQDLGRMSSRQKGPYTLKVELDTPEHTISDMNKLYGMLATLKQSPKENLLALAGNPEELSSLAVKLRKRIGALARYSYPIRNTYEAETPSAIVSDANSSYYLLTSPQKNECTLVYFGTAPVVHSKSGFLVLDGEDPQTSLIGLTHQGILRTSQTVLQERLANLQQLEDIIKIRTGSNHLLDSLVQADQYFAQVVNESLRINYLAQEGIQEFAVAPTTDDPVITSLLMRLTWNITMRNYHDTKGFIRNFELSNKSARPQLLTELQRNLVFTPQQNNGVNLWLYTNYRSLCEESGIKFQLVG